MKPIVWDNMDWQISHIHVLDGLIITLGERQMVL